MGVVDATQMRLNGVRVEFYQDFTLVLSWAQRCIVFCPVLSLFSFWFLR